MTAETALFDFWHELPPGENIHPKDRPFFNAADKTAPKHNFQTAHRPPSPWDGPLATAKVVVCYLNPRYSDDDDGVTCDGKKPKPVDWSVIRQQLSGHELLPDVGNWWKDWYLPRLRGMHASPARADSDLQFKKVVRQYVAIFNLCPYYSRDFSDADARLAAGLPSVWAAQRHLREVLISRAEAGEIFLVVARAPQMWGVVEGEDAAGKKCKTYKLIRNNRGGYLPDIGPQIAQWLRDHHGVG